MTHEEINQAVAKECGWVSSTRTIEMSGGWTVEEVQWSAPGRGGGHARPPSYATSLDACQEFISKLDAREKVFLTHEVLCCTVWTGKYPEDHRPSEQQIREALLFVSAEKLCEAFLKMRRIWRSR
jgi:hypothetical protein